MHLRTKTNLYPILPSWCLPDTNYVTFIVRTDTGFCPSFLFWSTINYERYKFVYGNKVNIWIHFIICSQLDRILKTNIPNILNTKSSVTFLLKIPIFCFKTISEENFAIIPWNKSIVILVKQCVPNIQKWSLGIWNLLKEQL